MWPRLRNKLRFLLRRDRFDRELTEELDFHREMLERDKALDGLDSEIAAAAARRQLGNITAARAASRDSWVFPSFDALLSDLRLVIRSLARAKGFTTAAILTFALGIGVNIAVFTALDRLMFRPLPFSAPDRLVQVHGYTVKAASPSAMLPADIGAYVRERARTIDDLAYTRASEDSVAIEGFGEAPVVVASATANLLRVLGIRPVAGRDFTPDDARPDGAPAEILLTHEVWRSRFGAEATAIDRVVGLGRHRYQIVGVLPAGFVLPSSLLTERTDALRVQRSALAGPPRQGEIVSAPIGRLRPGATVAQAQAEISALVDDMRRTSPGGRPNVVVQPLQQGLFFLYAKYLWLVVAAVALVLLVACVNLATLLLARGRSRERETVVRAALGASPARLIAPAVLESIVLCVASSAIAFTVCWWVQSTLAVIVPPNFRAFAVAGLDLRLIALTLAAALASAVVAGLVPVLTTRNTDLLAVLRRDDRRRVSRLRGGATLLAIEAALGVVLVTGAATTVPGFARLVLKNPGFEPANLYALDLIHGSDEDGRGGPRYTSRRVQDVLEIIRTQPGVRAAGALTQLPLGEPAISDPFWKARGVEGGRWGASSGVFDALGTRINDGRDFTTDEVDRGSPVTMLNESAAKQLWPGTQSESPVGRTVTIAGGVYTVVGLVADIQPAPGVAALPALFVPITTTDAPVTQSALVVAVRMAANQDPNATLLAARLGARFGPRPVRFQKIADDLIEPRLQRPRFLAVLFGALAFISVLLATVGISAVANCEIGGRRYEIAVRVALGATRRQIRRLVYSRVIRPVAVGAVLGAGIAWWGAGLLQALVFEVNARAPWTLVPVVVVIIATGVVAGWAPARRAAATDASVVLRES